MKHILTQVFVALGVLFLILIFIGIYFFVADPLNLRSMFSGGGPVQTKTSDTVTTTTGTSSEDGTLIQTPPLQTGGFQLSDAQKQALQAFGIDPATIPSSISAEQETCFISALGEVRVGEIKAGAVPSAMEFFKAKSCI